MPDLAGNCLDGCNHLGRGCSYGRTLQLHAGLELAHAQLLAVHIDRGARGNVGKITKGAVRHLDEKIVPFDCYNLTTLDRYLPRRGAGCFGCLGLHLCESQDRDCETSCPGHDYHTFLRHAS